MRTTLRDTICDSIRSTLAESDMEPTLGELIRLAEQDEELKGTDTVGWIEAWADTEE
jgi:hypothetical protein